MLSKNKSSLNSSKILLISLLISFSILLLNIEFNDEYKSNLFGNEGFLKFKLFDSSTIEYTSFLIKWILVFLSLKIDISLSETTSRSFASEK